MLKKTGYGVILWAVPYVTAIPLLPLMRSDLILFKVVAIGYVLDQKLTQGRR